MNFQNLKLTANGKSMLAKVATGGQVIFTKIAFGSGTTSKDVTTLTELVTKKQEFTIASKVVGVNGLLTLSCVWNNKNLTTGYYVNELGIYAKSSSSASEILFAYATDDSPSYIPAYGGSNVTSGIMKINLIYSSDANVTVQLEYGDKIVEVHNTDPDAHKVLFDGVKKTITDHVNSTNPHSDTFAKYVKKVGDTMTGNLTVPTVIGTLQGNADSATLAASSTKLQTARTINVTGTGFTTIAQSFDGTQNISIPVTLKTALQALSSVTPANDKIPYFNGTNTASLANFTSLARTILSQTTGEGVRNAIGAVNTEGAGVIAGDVSNADAWWVKFGGTIPLIIQGGMPTIYPNKYTITFPISFSSLPLCIILTTDRSGQDADHTHIVSYTKTNLIITGTGYTVRQPWLVIGI